MFTPGATLNFRYKLIDLLASGGMGQVWTAEDVLLGRNVAVKCVDPLHFVNDPAAIAILKDEARTGARLIGHPNVVTTLDMGTATDGPREVTYVVMEYVEGAPLAAWIGTHAPRLDPGTRYTLAVYIAWEVCKALSHAHSTGIVHRDIKPLNIFVSRNGITKVGDFGLSRFVEAVTRTHTVVKAMSPAYAAPEQWRGEKASSATDVYQLGCTMYHLLTQRLPFEAEALPGLMNAHLHTVPVSARELNPAVSEPVANIVAACLKKERMRRADLWQVFDCLAEELRVKHTLSVDVSGASRDVQAMVAKITDFDEKHLREGLMTFEFADFSECHSEAIALVLRGVHSTKLAKREKRQGMTAKAS